MEPPLTRDRLAKALPDLKTRFEAAIPLMMNRAHLKPAWQSVHVFQPPPDPLYASYLAMLHVTIEETLLKPRATALRYLIAADGLVVRQHAITGEYHSSDAATPYMEIVQGWVDGCKASAT